MPHEPPSVALQVHVVTVSTSRGPGEDRSGPLLRSLAESAGHIVTGHAIVPDDPDAIGTELDRALAASNVDVVLLTGGTGVSARDCTPRVVRSRLDRELPGFGEIFRHLSYAEIGAAAMLSDAVGGIARGRPVFALPGSTGACRLGLESLILPQLPHLASELRKEAPLPRKHGEAVRPVVRARATPDRDPGSIPLAEPSPMQPPRRGIDVVQTETPRGDPPEEAPAAGWQGAVAALGGRLLPAGVAPVPDALAAIPAAMDVLGSANARMKLVAADGRSWLLFGFPDLLRPASKVLAVREALPVSEVVALHRWPARVGICCELDDSLLPGTASDPDAECEARTGKPCPESGSLFATDSGAVWVQQRRYVRRWDGRRLGAEENVGPAIGSLLLSWSQR
jgi:molybdenum cofactor biosynthesis protein B